MMRTLAALMVALMTPNESDAARGDSRPEIHELLRRGDAFYAHRDDGKAAWEAIGFYKEALKAEPRSYAALWRLTRSYVDLADSKTVKVERRDLGKQAIEYAEQATQAAPGRVEGWFFGAAAVGCYATGIGILTAIREGIQRRFLGFLDRAVAIDRGFERAAPLFTYGRYWYELPWPMRNLRRSEHFLLEARHRGPARVRTVLYLAETHLAMGRTNDAVGELRACLALDPAADDPLDALACQRRCRELLAEHERR
jgi:hypothetical protein